MTAPPPRVSVVIPCFNLGALVHEAIDSVLAQTFQDVEIVVVDDGSTDDATRRTLADLDRPKTRVVRSENRGLSAARNLGIRESGGGYICSLDADDRLAPECLERGVQLLDAEPGVAFVSHWLETFGDEHWTWQPTRCDLGALLDLNGSTAPRWCGARSSTPWAGSTNRCARGARTGSSGSG